MAKTIAQLRTEAQTIKNATITGENTATRVGGTIEDVVDYIDAQEQGETITEIIDVSALDIQMVGWNGTSYISHNQRASAILSNNFGTNSVITSVFTSGKMMYHFWQANDPENVTINTLNTSTGTFLAETGWTGTLPITQIPASCNLVVVTFQATSTSQARGYLTSAEISWGNSLSNRVTQLENDVANLDGRVSSIENNGELDALEMYRGMKIPHDALSEVVVMATGDKITHDATHIVIGGKVYVVYCANSHDTGDSGEFSNYAEVRFDVYNSSNLSLISRQTIAANGYAVGGDTIDGGAGVPNAYLIGNTIHIIFGAKISGTWTEIHCTYDTSTSTLGSLEQCTMDGSPLTGAILATHSSLANTFNYQLSFNASIAEISINGTTYYYVCICSAARIANGLIVRTTDFKAWEFVAEPNLTGSAAQYEGAMGVYDGELYLALRQNVNGMASNGMLFAKLATDGAVIESRFMAACNSRPSFYNQDGKLYVIVPSGARSTATIYCVNGSVNNLTEMAVIAGAANTFGQYMEVVSTSPQYVTYSSKEGYSYTYVRLFKTNVIASDDDVLKIILSQLI